MKEAITQHPWRSLTLLVMLVAGITFWRSLPDPLFDVPLSSVLLSRDQQLLGARIAADDQWRFPCSATVPDKFARALVLYEDQRFYSHPGVDPLALGRALYLNLSRNHIVSGASTLSMQVLRLARRNPQRSYTEKLIEIVLALRLELSYSKAEILALYACHAPFGGNVVGVQTAAWRYFGRHAEQLSWAESAMLAVLPNSPSLIHPGRNRQQLKDKRDDLLQRLHDNGVLSATELQLARLEPLPDRPLPLPSLAPHLLDTLRAWHPQQQKPFVSSLDASLQQAVNHIVQQHSRQLSRQHIYNAATVVIDNHSFEVLAYVGNSHYLHAGNQRGYAVDLIQRPRSTGSILKPLLFASMLQQGELLPDTLVPDLPTQYAGYRPENYDHQYRGAVSARDALARSLNVPAVRILKMHGVGRFYDFLRNMGMTTLYRTAEDYGLTLVLGGAEGSLWDMAGMYANLVWLARQDHLDPGRRYRQPTLLLDLPAASGHYAELNPAAAWLTLDALLEVRRPGLENHWKKFARQRKVAWKTGTSYGLRDGWAIGSDARYTVAVWTGNASGEGRPGLTGVASAAPILFDIFNRLEPGPWLRKPIELMKPVRICRNDGYLATPACEATTVLIPIGSHFEKTSRHHVKVHLDASGHWRVHSRCEPVSAMRHESWFVLPAGQAFYYRRQHADYRSLPPWRPDCAALISSSSKQAPIEIIYPGAGTRLYIPVELGGRKSRVVFEAVHRDQNAQLYWHLDDQYLGQTRLFHQQALDITPGPHTLTLVDSQGNRTSRRFMVLARERRGQVSIYEAERQDQAPHPSFRRRPD